MEFIFSFLHFHFFFVQALIILIISLLLLWFLVITLFREVSEQWCLKMEFTSLYLRGIIRIIHVETIFFFLKKKTWYQDKISSEIIIFFYRLKYRDSSIYWVVQIWCNFFLIFFFFFYFFFFYYYSWYINFTKRKNILNWFLVLSSPPITFHNIFQYLTFQYLYMLFLFLFSDILNHSILKRYFIIIVFSFIFMFLNVTLFRVCPTSSR